MGLNMFKDGRHCSQENLIELIKENISNINSKSLEYKILTTIIMKGYEEDLQMVVEELNSERVFHHGYNNKKVKEWRYYMPDFETVCALVLDLNELANGFKHEFKI